MSGSKDKPVMEGFVTGDFKHRAHTFVLCLHPGDSQKSPIKEPSMSPLCHQSLLYPALQALTRGQAPTSKGMRVYSRAEHERQGPRDMVSDFAKPHVPMRQQCHEAFLKHNKESHKSKYSRKHQVGSYSNAGLS